MIKLLVLLVSMVISVQSYAMSFDHAKEIYIRIAKANGMFIIPKLVVKNSRNINAEARGSTIVVYTGMLANVRNDAEMALVLGHELAHGRLGHSHSNIPNEYAADKLGAQYSGRAGYNVCLGAKFLKRMGDKDSNTHPASIKRVARLGC